MGQVIPDEAVEAAMNAWNKIETRMDRGRMREALEAAAPHIMAQTLRDAADAIDAQRDESNPDRQPNEGWSVVDHRAGRFLGKTVAARLLRARAADLEATK